MKKLLIICSIAALLGVVTNIIYSRCGMHEQALFLDLAKVSDQWEESLRKNHSSIYVLASGSTGRFGVDPQVILDEQDIPLVVASGVAGFGLCPNTAIAWDYLQEGDTLILAFEEGLISAPNSLICTNSGLAQARSRLGFDMFKDGLIPFNYDHLRRSLMADSTLVSFDLGKSLFQRDNLYRYLVGTEINPSGWVEIAINKSQQKYPGHISVPKDLKKSGISPVIVDYYSKLQVLAKRKGVKIIASQHPYYSTAYGKEIRVYIALQLTRMGIPVIYTPNYGFHTKREWTADTQMHLNAEGTKHFSSLLAKSLKEQHFWTEEELIEELHKRGWNEDGSRIPAFKK